MEITLVVLDAIVISPRQAVIARKECGWKDASNETRPLFKRIPSAEQEQAWLAPQHAAHHVSVSHNPRDTEQISPRRGKFPESSKCRVSTKREEQFEGVCLWLASKPEAPRVPRPIPCKSKPSTELPGNSQNDIVLWNLASWTALLSMRNE